MPWQILGHKGRVAMHQVPDLQQPRAQLATWMEQAEMVWRKGPMLHQRDRQRIAQGQRHRGRGRWHDPRFAGFGHLRQQGCPTSACRISVDPFAAGNRDQREWRNRLAWARMSASSGRFPRI